VRVSAERPLLDLATTSSRARIFVVRADEELTMAQEAARLLVAHPVPAPAPRVPVAVSARHAHLSQATLDALFGAGHALQPKTGLSQRGQFSAQETVRLIGPRGSLEHVRLMGPAARARPGGDLAQRRVRARRGCAGADFRRSREFARHHPRRPARSRDADIGRDLRTTPHPHE
jgi:hypothetical protein